MANLSHPRSLSDRLIFYPFLPLTSHLCSCVVLFIFSLFRCMLFSFWVLKDYYFLIRGYKEQYIPLLHELRQVLCPWFPSGDPPSPCVHSLTTLSPPCVMSTGSLPYSGGGGVSQERPPIFGNLSPFILFLWEFSLIFFLLLKTLSFLGLTLSLLLWTKV